MEEARRRPYLGVVRFSVWRTWPYTMRSRQTVHFPIAIEGLPYVLLILAVSIVLALLNLHIVAALAFVASVFVAAFFRDPNREVQAKDEHVVSPADGKVIAVSEVAPSHAGDKPGTKVCIFMSLFNCHINRSPITGGVTSVQHTPGRFLAAFNQRASEVNERTNIELVDTLGDTFSCVQVAGIVARRIVCRIKQGDRVRAGQRIGMIKFGSRVDVLVPSTYEVLVKAGDRVKAGVDAIGRRRVLTQEHVTG